MSEWAQGLGAAHRYLSELVLRERWELIEQ